MLYARSDIDRPGPRITYSQESAIRHIATALGYSGADVDRLLLDIHTREKADEMLRSMRRMWVRRAREMRRVA